MSGGGIEKVPEVAAMAKWEVRRESAEVSVPVNLEGERKGTHLVFEADVYEICCPCAEGFHDWHPPRRRHDCCLTALDPFRNICLVT